MYFLDNFSYLMSYIRLFVLFIIIIYDIQIFMEKIISLHIINEISS